MEQPKVCYPEKEARVAKKATQFAPAEEVVEETPAPAEEAKPKKKKK